MILTHHIPLAFSPIVFDVVFTACINVRLCLAWLIGAKPPFDLEGNLNYCFASIASYAVGSRGCKVLISVTVAQWLLLWMEADFCLELSLWEAEQSQCVIGGLNESGIYLINSLRGKK